MCIRDSSRDYLSDDKGLVENSPTSGKWKIWKMAKGLYGKNTLTFYSPYKKGYAIRHQGYRAKVHRGTSTLFRKDASFHVTKGLIGAGVSFMSVNYRGHFLMHAGYRKNVADHAVSIVKYYGRFKQKKAATFYPKRVKCP